MSKITYEDKVALNINQDVADVNKCNATDLNEIKQVVNQNDINKSTYSTTEKVVGKWINGKPLYRKVINFTTTISADTVLEINHGVNNVEMIWFDPIGCFMWASSGFGYNIPMIGYSGNITDKLYTFVDKTKISIHANGSWGTIWTKYITLLYTKTTD